MQQWLPNKDVQTLQEHIKNQQSGFEGNQLLKYLDALNNEEEFSGIELIKYVYKMFQFDQRITISPERLRSIFSFVELHHNVNHDVYYQMTKMDMTNIFPEKNLKEITEAEMQTFFQEFYTDLLKVLGSHFRTADAFIVQLQSVIEKFAWCLPAGDGDLRYVSLSEHCKLMAAMVAILSKQEILSQASATMVVGDLSGIQNYIFDISQTGAGGVAKRLRARSFQISAISDIVAHRILHQFELPIFNMVISSGGKFYLLLPGNCLQYINNIQKELDEWVLSQFNGEIIFNFGVSQFSIQEILKVDYVFENLNISLQRRKANPLLHGLMSNGKWDTNQFLFSKPIQGRCKSCGKFNIVSRDMCSSCLEDEELGRELAKARYIVYKKSNTANGAYSWSGYSVDVVKNIPTNSEGIYLIYRLNEFEFGIGDLPIGTKFLANYIPISGKYGCEHCIRLDTEEQVKPNSPLLFECIAYHAEGENQLAYLKADVDNLGSLFAFGLKKEAANVHFSHVTTLSKMLELFFSGWLNQTMETKYEHVYTVFSGGDDLFLIGAWNQIVSLAKDIRESFRRFVGYNPNITVSAGLIFSKPSQPVYIQADRTENELQNAKEVPSLSRSEGRDQLSLFSDPLTWIEFDELLLESKKLSEWWKEKQISSAFIYRLINYSEMYREYLAGDNSGLRFLPLLTYDISRNLDVVKQREVIDWVRGFIRIDEYNPLINIERIVKLARLFKGSSNATEREGIKYVTN